MDEVKSKRGKYRKDNTTGAFEIGILKRLKIEEFSSRRMSFFAKEIREALKENDTLEEVYFHIIENHSDPDVGGIEWISDIVGASTAISTRF